VANDLKKAGKSRRVVVPAGKVGHNHQRAMRLLIISSYVSRDNVIDV
jgi:hypothetical protein